MEVVTQIQGSEDSSLTPLFLIHAISGLAIPFFRLDPLSEGNERPVYGITSPLYCNGHEKFTFPSSMRQLSSLYVEQIRKVQPRGPYLLGGWSMGGMIAMDVAHILQSRGERILKVIMIDSGNPEAFPAFENDTDNDTFARLLLSRVLNPDGRGSNAGSGGGGGGRSRRAPPPGARSPAWSSDAEEEGQDYLTARRRRQISSSSGSSSTWDLSTPKSSSTSLDDLDESPSWTPLSPVSTTCTSVRSSRRGSLKDGKGGASPLSKEIEFDTADDDDDDDDDDSDSNSDSSDEDEDDEDNEDAQEVFLRKMSFHIRKGLRLISSIRPGELLPIGEKSNFSTVLIKCRPLPAAAAATSDDDPSEDDDDNDDTASSSARSELTVRGAQAIRDLMREKVMRWDGSRFAKFETVPFSGDHDRAFEPQFVGELSGILFDCLKDVD